MALEKGTEEWMMFGEYFNLCKKYWQVNTTDEYWDALITDSNNFADKYKFPLATKLVFAFLEAQESRLKI